MESARCLFILLQIPAFWAECREGAVLFVQLFERGGDGVTKSSFALHSRSDAAGERIEFDQHLCFHEFLGVLHSERFQGANRQAAKE
jgi:hypothetical protein